MTGKTSLILGFYAHIFPSASDEEFEKLYQTRIKPFVTVLNQFPKIPAAIHFSGFLFSRLEQKKPELFLLIKDMAARKQLELLGGGFYEPLVPLLPPADRMGQIEMLTTYIRQNFGRRPQGCILASAGWEQSLVPALAACGMSYTFLSEEQFAAAGSTGDSLLTPVCTEDQGKLLVVFPVFSSLSSAMGKDGALTALRDSSRYPNDTQGVITVFPEFSSENAELRMYYFFEELNGALADKNKHGSLELTTPGRVCRSGQSFPRLYFSPSGAPSCSQPRSFLTRYPEANELYSKIYFTHNAINQLRGDKSRKRGAREELWKAQGYETLTHSHNREVRRYANKAILAAERIIREKDFKPSLLIFDFDFDRAEEYLFQDKNINCFVKTRGAAVFELDYLPKGLNYLDSFSGGLEKRSAFTDILLPGDFVPPLDSAAAVYVSSGQEPFPENSRFCGAEEYKILSADRAKLKASFVLAPKKGIPFGAIEIRKTYSLEKNVLNLSYALCNRGEEKTILCFAPRFDLALLGDRLLFRKSQGEEEIAAAKQGAWRRVLAFEEQGSKYGASLGVSFQTPCDLYLADLEEHCQTCCFLPVFQLFLNPGDTWENRITLSVSAKARKNS